jgi:hypothetical protein
MVRLDLNFPAAVKEKWSHISGSTRLSYRSRGAAV